MADYLRTHDIPVHLDAAVAALLVHRPPNIRSFLSAYFELASSSQPPTLPPTLPPASPPTAYINRTALRGVIDNCTKSLLTTLPSSPLRHLANYFSQDYWVLRDGVPDSMEVVSRRAKVKGAWTDVTFDTAPHRSCLCDVIAKHAVPVVGYPEEVTVAWIEKMLSHAGIHKSGITEVTVVDEGADFGSPLRSTSSAFDTVTETFPRRASSFSPARRGGTLLPTSPLKMDIAIHPITDQGAQSTVYTINTNPTKPNVPKMLILKLCRRSEWCDDAAVAAREMWFYKEVAPLLKGKINLPRMYWGGSDGGVGNLVLEDITASNDVRSTELSDWPVLYKNLAVMHRVFYELPEEIVPQWFPNYQLSADLLTQEGLPHAVWVFGPFAGSPFWKGPVTGEVVARLRQGVERFVRYEALGAEHLPEYDELFKALPQYVQRVSKVRTVCRGDCHLWNSFIRGSQIVFYDFAEWSTTHPAGELAYAWYSSWLKDQAPVDYHDLLTLYYEELGGCAPFTYDQLVYDFRVSAVYVVVLHLRYVFDQWEMMWEAADPVSLAKDVGAEDTSWGEAVQTGECLVLKCLVDSQPEVTCVTDEDGVPCRYEITPEGLTAYTEADSVVVYTPLVWVDTATGDPVAPDTELYASLTTAQWTFDPTPGYKSHPTTVNDAHRQRVQRSGGPDDADVWDAPLQFCRDLYDLACWLKE